MSPQFSEPVQFQLPTPSTQSPTVPATPNTSASMGQFTAPVQFQLPQNAQQQPISSQEAAQYLPLGFRMGTSGAPTPQEGQDTLIGAAKGVLSTLQSANVLDTMNKMAGQPTLKDITGVDPNQAFAPSNPTQETANIQTQIGAGLLAPSGAAEPDAASLLSKLPARLTQGALKLDPKTAQYALDTKKIGSVGGLYNQSLTNLKSIGSSIGDVLKNKYAGITGDGVQAAEKAAKSFTQGSVTANDIMENAADLLGKTKSKLVDKYLSGEATLADKNALKTALDRRVSSIYKNPTAYKPEAKELGGAFASALRDEVKTHAPETNDLFDQYQKELNLKNTLGKLNDKSPRNLIGLRDLWAIAGGAGAGALSGGMTIPGAAIGYGLERLASTPAGQFALAKGAQKIPGILKGATAAGTAGLLMSQNH